ncbi:uncharacterized protein LOC110114991 [Dendrobium catenatum]|uniref:uncharacterized protein LOC110114991 n=1 Tax=Dendrobium catenatum TaxID=906689 RepID=UPI0009F5D504|nr:uncharacterized protein LOC110114991 [Dendrobium catenatum]
MSEDVFPPLPSSAAAAGSTISPSTILPLWKNLLTSAPQISSDFSHSLGFTPTQNFTTNFTTEQFVAGAPEWSLSLVGYSIGKRPFYESLLATIKKAWQLKGEISLLTLDDGFFLLKFSALEDYDFAWTRGPWFFFGKPFILQKWTPDFVPKREEFPSIPLWVKILNLPLSLWTPEGISKLASCIGIPIAVDALTAAKTRLTFARVCVQITSTSTLPDEIFYNVDGKVFPLRVQYDWKPDHCSQCGSIMHPPSLCPKDPIQKPVNHVSTRGRSSSRKPRPSPPPKLNIPKPPQQIKPQTNNTQQAKTQISNPVENPMIPNLNSPSGDVQDSLEIQTMTQEQPLIKIANKFQTLSDHDKEEDGDSQPPSHNLYQPHSPKNPNTSAQDNINLLLNHNSPAQTSPRSHQPNIPTTSNDSTSSSSHSTKTQTQPSQNVKQTRVSAAVSFL